MGLMTRRSLWRTSDTICYWACYTTLCIRHYYQLTWILDSVG